MQQASSSSSSGSSLLSASGISSSSQDPSLSSSAWCSGSSGTWETWRCQRGSYSPSEILGFLICKFFLATGTGKQNQSKSCRVNILIFYSTSSVDVCIFVSPP